MKCSSPIGGRQRVDGVDGKVMYEYPCGYCKACRITRRQQWTFRILLELRQHLYNYFVTLTYAPDFLPENGSLVPADLQLFMKRLRYYCKQDGVGKIRFFGVGEYGEKKGRPHYHVLIFSDQVLDLKFDSKMQVIDSPFHKAWQTDYYGLKVQIGLVDVRLIPTGDDGHRIARYCAGYVVKKWTTLNSKRIRYYMDEGTKVYYSDITDLREPEFSRSSRNPGIGLQESNIRSIAAGMKKINVAASYHKKHRQIDATTGLYMLKMHGKLWPVDRVLRQKIFDKLGEDWRSNTVKAIESERLLFQRWKEREDSYFEDLKENEYKAEKKIKFGKKDRF